MHVGEHAWKLLDSSDALRPTGPEHFWERVDPGRADADVVHTDARVVGLLDRVRRIGPGVPALVTLIGHQAVTDHDQQAPLGRLRHLTSRLLAQRGAEPGVAAGLQPEAARRYETGVVEVLQAADLDSVSGVSGEHEDSMALAGMVHSA